MGSRGTPRANGGYDGDEFYTDPTAHEPINRVLALCDFWDKISKGETSTTRQIRAAIKGES